MTMTPDTTYLRCVACGWVHCAATESERGCVMSEKQHVCLLDREPIMTDMTNCDRYEPKDEA
jgi:hypothetical protein